MLRRKFDDQQQPKLKRNELVSWIFHLATKFCLIDQSDYYRFIRQKNDKQVKNNNYTNCYMQLVFFLFFL